MTTRTFDSKIILSCPMNPDTNDAEACSIGEYLQKLLLRLWRVQEGFDGKRPFGNSGWEHEISDALVRSNVVSGEINEDGDIVDFDYDELTEAIECAIVHAFSNHE